MNLRAKLKSEVVLLVALLLAALSALVIPPDLAYLGYMDYRVIALLFCLMITMAGFQKIGVFQILADALLRRTKNTRQLMLVLVGLCFFSSMLITNDVALITFVPFALYTLSQIGLQRKMISLVVLQTIAANLGSMMTPLGNPQNLYLYSIAGWSFVEFVQIMLRYSLLALLLLVGCIVCTKSEKINMTYDMSGTSEGVKMKDVETPRPLMKKLMLYLFCFLLCIATVIHLVPYQVTLAVMLLLIFSLDRSMFRMVDYGLLLTFAGFFVFIGNMGRIPAVRESLEFLLEGRVCLVSMLLSQVISNVPAAILLSGFTVDYQNVLIGVNIGGLGTLIASLASLISYKYYAKTEGAKKGKYLLIFTIYNIVFLLCMYGLYFI